jgi:hypothetical protein
MPENDLKAAAFPRLSESQMAAQFVHEFLRESAVESRTAPADRQPQPAGANAWSASRSGCARGPGRLHNHRRSALTASTF